MKIDAKDRRITVHASVCLTQGILELLLCKAKSKEYESLLSTAAAPSDVHAALLALGLVPGVPAHNVVIPDVETPITLPPMGAELTVRLRWTDKKSGAVKEVAAGDWLEWSKMQKNLAAPKTWVFVGSEITSAGTYGADEDGNIISVSNFVDSVMDVPFESTRKERVVAYRAKTAAIPPVGTAVDVIIEAVANAEHAAHARLTLDVDRTGCVSLNGREIPAEGLMNWAQKFTDDHSKGQVTLRVDGRALAADIPRIQQELRLGGVFDVEPVILQPPSPLPPRSRRRGQGRTQGMGPQVRQSQGLHPRPRRRGRRDGPADCPSSPPASRSTWTSWRTSPSN